jgi:hypothetical protein
MGEYFVAVGAVDVDDLEIVAAYLGRRGEDVKGTRWDAGLRGYWILMDDVEPPADPNADRLSDLAEIHLGKKCGVFWATRRSGPGQPLQMGYWLKVYSDEEPDRWVRLEYLGKTMGRARWVMRKLSR